MSHSTGSYNETLLNVDYWKNFELYTEKYSFIINDDVFSIVVIQVSDNERWTRSTIWPFFNENSPL